MISIVQYGVGNVQAFLNAYRRIGVPAMAASSPDDLRQATKIILPGVGAFDTAMALLDESGLLETLTDRVLGSGVPVLGVCVGMQMLAHRSEEGRRPGLGWVDGEVKKFTACDSEGHPRRVPHMGWNDVQSRGISPLLTGLLDARFYFLHSFYFDCRNQADVLATADYAGGFACAVGVGNIFGVQFHPEKSHEWGSRLLQNFAEL